MTLTRVQLVLGGEYLTAVLVVYFVQRMLTWLSDSYARAWHRHDCECSGLTGRHPNAPVRCLAKALQRQPPEQSAAGPTATVR